MPHYSGSTEGRSHKQKHKNENWKVHSLGLVWGLFVGGGFGFVVFFTHN